MHNVIKLVLVFMGIWIVASLINGTCCGIYTMIMSPSNRLETEQIPICIFGSFFFSIPFIFLTWFITVIAYFFGSKAENLFRVTLTAAFGIAILSGILLIFFLGNEIKEARYGVAIIIVISALCSVLFFRNTLKAII